MTDTFRTRLLQGDLLIGTMITLTSPEVAEIMAEVGFDWLFLDAEHSVFEAREIQALLQAAGAAIPCVVRLPVAAEVPIKKALDVGAAGIIAPQINSAAQAEQVVRLAKYAPDGTRGVGIGRASLWPETARIRRRCQPAYRGYCAGRAYRRGAQRRGDCSGGRR